jgi:transcriptional regulator with XRE-family HTH domain
MDLSAYRKLRGLSLEQVALELGLRSKGYFSRIESGAISTPLRLALQIEEWSNGQVPAAGLVSPEDAALLAKVRQRATADAEARA